MTGSTVTTDRQIALLGILLLALHVVYGITAIIGMLINHTLGTRVRAPYDTHIRWQLATFWVAAFGYLGAIHLWMNDGQRWPLALVALWTLYRIASNVWYWLRARPIERWW